jgi:O-antigen ligase
VDKNSFLRSKFLSKSNIAIFAVLFMIIGFFVSRVVLSMSMVLFGINALWNVPPRAWLKDKWWLLGVVWVAIYGLSRFWSEDLAFWNDRFQVKYAILLLPLAFYFTPAFTVRQLRIATWVLGLAMLAASGYTLSFLLRDPSYYVQEYNVSHVLPTIPKGDHIRFSLDVACSVVWMVLIYRYLPDRLSRLFIIITVGLLSVFLHILAARTGLIALYLFIAAWSVYLLARKKTRGTGFVFTIVIAFAVIAAFTYIPTLKQRLGYFKYTVIVYNESKLNSIYSDMSRVISYDVSLRQIKQHPLIGVGAGDILVSMKKGYDQWYPEVAEGQRLVPHNQFLTVGLGCGIPAMLLFAVWVFYPLFTLKRNRAGFFLLAVWLMLFLSLLVEPMLEVQFGVFVYLFFLLWFRHFMLKGIDVTGDNSAGKTLDV